ncbi:MAG: hypothetical protein LBH85_01595 [Treponema sp.]|jgi:hypothetical protein|nr:hypothetical protein [Treponema sp.]
MVPFGDELACQLEQSPFSEEFVIAGDEPVCLTALDGEVAAVEGGNLRVWGIFDESVERDSANNAIRKKPRLYVYRWIYPLPPESKVKVIVRGKKYTAESVDKDANMGFVVWLR